MREVLLTRIAWAPLAETWATLTAMFDNYESGEGSGWDTLVEARRLVEIEMREQGYETQWRDLTNSGP